MVRCEDLLVVVTQLEKALVGDPYAQELLKARVQSLKSKLIDLVKLIDENRSLEGSDGWLHDFELAFDPMLSLLSQQLSEMSQQAISRTHWGSIGGNA
jgi:hypothetical protein